MCISLLTMKLDGDGNIQWQTKLIRAPLVLEFVPRSIKATPEGGALIALGSFVAKLSPEGEIEFEHFLMTANSGDVIVNDVLPNADGYVAVGMACVYSGSYCSNFHAFAGEVSSTGTMQWAKTYAESGPFYSVQQATPTSFYAEALADNLPRLYHLDNGGNVVWALAMNGLSAPTYAPGAVDASGRIWYGRGDQAGDARLRRIDPDGFVEDLLVGTANWSESASVVTVTTLGIAAFRDSDFGTRLINLELSDPGCLTVTPTSADATILLEGQVAPLTFAVATAGISTEAISLTRTCVATGVRRECAASTVVSRLTPRTEAVGCGIQLDFEFAQPQKVLIHKFGSGDDYPSEYQRRVVPSETIPNRDRHIEVRVRATASGTPVPDQPVYFRVTDSKDTAAYAAADARTDDNADPKPKGDLLTLEPCTTTPPLPAGVVCARSAPDGYARVILRTSEHIVGENYHVQGSLDEQFTCAPACAQSGRIETWKRAYLEVGRMFKKGLFVLETSDVGTTKIAVADATRFKPGDRVVLLSGPPLPRFGPSSPATEYRMEARTILPNGVKINNPGPTGALELDAPIPAVRGIDVDPDQPPSLVADFVGIVTGNDDDDYYEANLAYVPSLFADAFVEYVVMPPVPLPLVETMGERLDAPMPFDDEANNFAKRWFRHFGYANHQFIMGIRETTSQYARGVTRAVEGFSYSHVMVKRILGAFGTAASRRLLGELTAHEVSHQWHTNRRSSHTSDGSHCNASFRYWDDSSKHCLMHFTYQDSGGSTLPEFTDDVVRFHYRKDSTGVDSEYRWIRERCEPVSTAPLLMASDWWASPPSPCR